MNMEKYDSKTSGYDVFSASMVVDIQSDTSIENKNNIDAELKERNKDCGCYYQAWSPSHLYMGLLGLGLMAGSSGHCENDNPTEVKEITPAPSE